MQEFGSVVARVKAEWVVVSGVARAKSRMYKSVGKGRGGGEIGKRYSPGVEEKMLDLQML
jgi:hypothetical protein